MKRKVCAVLMALGSVCGHWVPPDEQEKEREALILWPEAESKADQSRAE